MPYVIALVIIIVAAGALLLFNQQAQAPTSSEVLEVQTETAPDSALPEGYTPPTEQPPTLNPGEESESTEIDSQVEVDNSVTPEVAPEAVAAPSETFVAEASYFTPRRTEHDMLVTLELDGETVVDANVDYDGGVAATPAHSGFDAAYKAEVIGQNINDIELSRTGGASLTSVAFNEAVAEIRAQI